VYLYPYTCFFKRKEAVRHVRTVKMSEKISSAVIRRLPKYYRYVDELYQKGITRISSKILAQDIGLTASQVRQDFSCFGGFGQQGYGYHVESLRAELAEILKLNAGFKAVLIGAGNLGLALLNHFAFNKNGISLIAAFDCDPAKIGTTVNDIPILPIDSLESFCQETNPDLAVLTVPQSVAENLAQTLLSIGIRGLWNFTNVDIHTDDDSVVLENVHLSDSLMTLSCRL